jgi:tRNA threonylcarbamoyladenosine biosynthesis protein TsaE
VTNTADPFGEHVTPTESDTAELGRSFGAQLEPGAVVLLSGELGAGKTIFVRGLAQGLGVDPDDVHSPSFTLVNYYPAATPLYHIDLYRLDTGANAAYAVDLDEILQNEAAIVVIEWAERLGNFPLPPDHWTVEIVGDGDEPRKIAIMRNASRFPTDY